MQEGALSFAGNTPKGLGEGLGVSVNSQATSVSGKGNYLMVKEAKNELLRPAQRGLPPEDSGMSEHSGFSSRKMAAPFSPSGDRGGSKLIE